MIYLASPYSHPEPRIKEARFRAVSMAAAQLFKRGHLVFCPIAMSHPLAVYGNMDGSWETWAEFDRAMIPLCGTFAIYGLHGWSESVGVEAEHEIATEHGLNLEVIHPRDLGLKDVEPWDESTWLGC